MKKTVFKFITALFAFALLVSVAAPFAAEAAVKVGAPKVSSVEKSGDSGIKVTWKAVEGAKGYRIYRKTADDKSYVKVATTSKLSYTDKKWTAKGGTSIKYVVKAYVKEDGKTIWSAKSKAKSYKVPAPAVDGKPEDLLVGTWEGEGETFTFYKPGESKMNPYTDQYTFWNISNDGIYVFSNVEGEKMIFNFVNSFGDVVSWMRFDYYESSDSLRVVYIDPDGEVGTEYSRVK